MTNGDASIELCICDQNGLPCIEMAWDDDRFQAVLQTTGAKKKTTKPAEPTYCKGIPTKGKAPEGDNL